MINANELRKGNKIIFEGMLLTVKEIKEHDATFLETPAAVEYPDIDPVPLNPGILEACGFVDPAQNGMGCRISVNSVDEIAWYRQDNSIRYQTKGSGFTRNFNIKYLHQLQNLYYLVTGGTELTVNLEKVKDQQNFK